MKNILTALFLFALIAGCSGEKENKQEETELKQIDLKGQNVTIDYKFSKGDEVKYKLTTITTAKETIQADTLIESRSNENTVYQFDIKVIEVEPDNTSELDITISSLKINADINGQKFVYDASAKNNKEQNQKFIQYYAIHNVPYRARVSKKGEVLEVSRLDKMVDKMNSLQPENQKLTTEQKVQLSKSIGDAIIRPLTQLIFRELPTKKLAKDSTWVKTYPSQLSVFNINNNVRYKVDGFVEYDGNRAISVSANLKTTWTGNKSGEENGIKYNFEDPKINGEGKILFDIDRGLLIKSETGTTVELKANLEMMNSMQKKIKTVRKDITTNKNIIELL
ncbi:DUF6263 family protein [Melioribacter sp. OK-6-Me]|uniref:DUF6263 family protein n=1 Tax=unclassified Melioribacter TaxID=2627329 RepID=UPI003ED9633B